MRLPGRRSCSRGELQKGIDSRRRTTPANPGTSPRSGLRGATIGTMLEAVKQLSSVLEGRPTPTARAYEQFGFWADVQGGDIIHYPMHLDGSWDDEGILVEFACRHLLDAVNRDFGTEFTMDEFEEGDCNCES